jgi:hypothetical protein
MYTFEKIMPAGILRSFVIATFVPFPMLFVFDLSAT